LAIWKKGLAVYDEMEGIAWKWQSADGVQVEAPLAQESVGPNPTDREKKGVCIREFAFALYYLVLLFAVLQG